jgi:hypothetical protein
LIGEPPTPSKPVTDPSDARRAHRSVLRHRRNRRAVLSVGALVVVLAIGTIGFHLIAGTNLVDSFYFESMLATGQGPPFPLTTDTAKLFASGMAFLSVGTVVSTLILNLGPILGRWWREGFELAEREVRKVEAEVEEELRGAGR